MVKGSHSELLVRRSPSKPTVAELGNILWRFAFYPGLTDLLVRQTAWRTRGDDFYAHDNLTAPDQLTCIQLARPSSAHDHPAR